MIQTTTVHGRSNSLHVTNSSSTPISPTTQPKDITIIPSASSSGVDDDSLSKSLGHFSTVQGTNMPRGSYHDIKSRYFMSLNLSSPNSQKTPPQQQPSPSLPNSSGSIGPISLLTNNTNGTNQSNRPQRTSSLSSQLARQPSSPVQKQSQQPRDKKQAQIDFYKHSDAIPIPSKFAGPISTVTGDSLLISNGTYEPSLAPSLMSDDSTPMMFDGDFSFTDSSDSGSIDLSPFFSTQTTTSSPSPNNNATAPSKSNMAGTKQKRSSLKKNVTIKIETTTSAVRDNSREGSSAEPEDRSPLTPNRAIVPPHLLNNRSDFSLYRQQQKYNTKVYKI